MHLLPVGQYQAFAGGDAPDQRDVVLFAAAGRAGFAGGESVGVGKAETPSDATFGVGDAFAAGYGGEVDGVEGSLGGGAGGGGDRHDYFFMCAVVVNVGDLLRWGVIGMGGELSCVLSWLCWFAWPVC